MSNLNQNQIFYEMVLEAHRLCFENPTLSFKSLHNRLAGFFIDRNLVFSVHETKRLEDRFELSDFKGLLEKNEWLEDVAIALDMRANWIETHDVTLSRVDALNFGLVRKIRSLDQSQEELVRRLRTTANFLRTGV